MKLSIVIPIYNEQDSIKELYHELKSALDKLGQSYEIIAVDDGSLDNGLAMIEAAALADKNFKVIIFKKNFGQTAAMAAGIDFAQGEVIIPMDADLQNDPQDIRRLLEKLEEGFDVVSGWRRNRQDKLFSRKIPSQIANSLISLITKVKLHDYGCTLKAYRREVIKDIKFYGEMHRFMPAYAAWYGAKITEIEVNHRVRKYGITKYGISRTLRVVLDLLTVKFLTSYLTKPMHFFGKIGFWLFFFGCLSGIAALWIRFFEGIHLISTPLPLLAAFLVLMSIQFILMGLLAEIIIRGYYESQKKPIYLIKNKINLKQKD